MKISLALIVKADDNEAKRLDNCLRSCAKAFDEVVITITGDNSAVEAVAKKYDAKISHFDWINDFAAARTYNFAQATGDWVFWLDSDDIVRGVDNLRKAIELAENHGVTGLSTLYHYSHDHEGKVEDSHWKLQAVKAGHYEWKGVIHEDLLPVKPCKNANIHDVVRVHTATKKDSQASLERNLSILEQAIKTEPDEPRHYFYLARCYLGVEDWGGVIASIERYLELSNWKAERYDALNMMGEAYLRLGSHDSALKVHQAAILELEDAPDAYIYKARNYVQKGEWINALTNLEIAETRDKDAVVLKRAALYDHDLYILSAISLLNLGHFAHAKACAERAYANRSTEQAKEIVDLATEMLRDEELTLSYRKLGEYLLEDKEKVGHLINSMPDQIRHDPRILALQFGAEDPTVWPENSVAIYCGNSVEAWDGNTAKTGGIGGSETAVIEIAKELVKRGKQVTVYNRCDADHAGITVDGVVYKNYWQFNKADEFDVLWSWRSPALADHKIKARKHIVDMHDVSSPDVFTEERLRYIDYVFVKTMYHRSLYPTVPEKKIVVVGNGIDLARFTGQKAIKNPNRIIYTSTQNRGLEQILDMWPAIKAEATEAELHVFYGWNTYFEMNKDNPAAMDWMHEMQKKLAQEGIVNHGRVGQGELAIEMLQSAIWLYPTQFPEIHCITALEMQAAGVYPITSGFAALAETQVAGAKIEGDPKSRVVQEKYVSEVLMAIENPDMLRRDLREGREYVEKCSWENVTNIWENILWNTAQ